jgi:hypothetical protein
MAGVLAGCACLTLAACGDSSRRPPTQRDVATIATAVSDIVYQCQSVATGFIAAPDAASLQRDVKSLLDADRRVRSDASFTVGSRAGITRKTTLSKEMALAARNLTNANCAPAQAKRLRQALGD